MRWPACAGTTSCTSPPTRPTRACRTRRSTRSPDACLEQLELTLTDLGIVLDFAGPLASDVNRRATLLGIHSLMFSPMFTPPPVTGVVPVYGVDSAEYPYPPFFDGMIPQVPATYEFDLTPGYYNTELALFFVEAVDAIEDHTDGANMAVADYQGGTVLLHTGFDHRYTEYPQRAAALLMHEAAHAQGLGHKSCDATAETCAGYMSQAGDDCDCDYVLSAYWIEAAFAEAAALGRVVSFFPNADNPIDEGVAVGSYFPATRCEDTREHVTPFAASNPSCSLINIPMINAIEANSSYWNSL